MSLNNFDHYASFSMADRSRSKIWFEAVKRLSSNKKTTTVIEVGVGQGGRIALAALALAANANSDSRLIGFDRFERPLDYGHLDSQFEGWERSYSVEEELSRLRLPFADSSALWITNVEELCESTGYRGEINLIAGDVETQAPKFLSSCGSGFEIDVLSISCNWYSGVKASVESFFPCLASNALVMLDGYFYWGGFKKACEEYGIDDAYPGAFQSGDCLVLQNGCGK
jgi:hypothetical protein